MTPSTKSQMMHTYRKFMPDPWAKKTQKEPRKAHWSSEVSVVRRWLCNMHPKLDSLLCIWIVGVIDEDKILLSSDPVKIICPTFRIMTREDKKTSQEERIKRHFSKRGKFVKNAWESVPSLQGFEPTSQDGTSYTSRLIKLWSFAHSGLQFVYAFLYIYEPYSVKRYNHKYIQ